MTPFACAASAALADAHQLVRCLCVAASGESVAALYDGAAAAVGEAGDDAGVGSSAADTGAAAGRRRGGGAQGAGASASGGGGGGGSGDGAGLSATVADAATVSEAIARGGRLSKLKRLGRDALLDAIQAHHVDVVRRGSAAVTGARHACTWRHFSTTGGIWFRTGMSVVARLLLWMLGYARLIIALLFCAFVYLFFIVGRWLIEM